MSDTDTPLHTDARASRDADAPRASELVRFGSDKPLKLDAGVSLSPFQVAYTTYGTLNDTRSNAVLICHALTGDQHVANLHPVTGKPGWWETMVGPGRPLDTDSYFIICPNVIGGCMGSTGPASTNPATGKLWGLDFPIITIPDMVRAQAMLLDRLGIDTLFFVKRYVAVLPAAISLLALADGLLHLRLDYLLFGSTLWGSARPGGGPPPGPPPGGGPLPGAAGPPPGGHGPGSPFPPSLNE